LYGGAGEDLAYGGDGNDIYHFDAFDGRDHFDGGAGWVDVIALDASGNPNAPADSPWTVEVNGEMVQFDMADQALELSPDSSGVITLHDGSELSFEGVERIIW
ncbi:MAG: hypothetical protein KDK91_21170, partial [Gammaproteobacteria bacterium]|nr:hypothetical protein [Gammaproteobacteria bacterium]